MRQIVVSDVADEADDTHSEGNDGHLGNEFHRQPVCYLQAP